ncbi:MAG TPA: beta-galactosidase, partial [Ardenticatenaceae bacterium]|nr:beta-galactosidase [Ardenticatenaceae bacterium]
DVALMRACHVNVATVGVFSWTALQPSEDSFDFAWLDNVLEKLSAAGIYVCLATPTAAQPAWMSQKYPDVLRSDSTGRRRHHGRRANYCPNSPTYRRFAVQIATRLAERYGRHPALVAWHISNEYGGFCMCEICAAAFRVWLQRKYASLDEVNARWWTRFWSHTYTDWSQIEPPYSDGETLLHGLTIDYKRFQSDSTLECFKLERDAIRAVAPGVPITTNMMESYPNLDYRAWAPEIDVISWDSYPRANAYPGDTAFLHDLFRGLKDGQPFMLLEQTPSTQNWQPVNALKRPGVLRLWSYQAVAHGAETVMYFQWRRSRGGSEKFHGAVVDHAGRADTRVFREVAELGAELERLGVATLGAATPARVAVLFDWENWWSLDEAQGPIQEHDYVATVKKHYNALWRRNIPVDIVFGNSDLRRYALVIAPLLHMVTPAMAARIEAMVAQGGAFVTTYFSGVVGATNLAHEGYPGPLRNLQGIWVEEIDALFPGQENQIVMGDGSGTYTCGRLCDILHSEGAQVLATYGREFYAGTPVLTEHRFGQGRTYYIASDPEARFLDDFYGRLLQAQGIEAGLETPAGVEVTVRDAGDRQLIFVLNHNPQPVTVTLPSGRRYHDLLAGEPVTGTLALAGYGVAVLG